MKLPQKIGLWIGLAMLVSSPLTNQYIQQAIDWALTELSKQVGSYVTIVGTVYLLGLVSFYWYKSERVHIPKKSTKTSRAGAYIKT